MEFLTFLIGRIGIKIDPSRIFTVVEWLKPKNIKEI